MPASDVATADGCVSVRFAGRFAAVMKDAFRYRRLRARNLARWSGFVIRTLQFARARASCVVGISKCA